MKEPLQEDIYEDVLLRTNRGDTACRYYEVPQSSWAVIWVGGIGGDWDSPALGLYPSLSNTLIHAGISSLRVKYRHLTDLEESVIDVMAGIEFLNQQGHTIIGLTGHSLGGAVAIRAGVASPHVKSVITLASQSFGAESVEHLAPDCSLLLMHGSHDDVLPVSCSEHIYQMAHEPKELVILPENGHSLIESAKTVKAQVTQWLLTELKARFPEDPG